jgi:hypothetical protein
MSRSLVVLLALLAPRIAVADEDRIAVKIAVGETREIEVGFARMHLCDDTSIVEAEMRDKTLETNVFVVKGLKPGTTECRAGLDPDRPSFLFSITVEKSAAKPKPAPKR